MSSHQNFPAFAHIAVLGAIFAVFAPSGSAQSTNAAGDQTAQGQEQVVQMSTFEVTTTQGHGYTSTNATSGLKTNQPIMDIPQALIVVTKDLIDDLGYADSSEILNFVGLGQGFEGESLQMRGFGTGYAYVDDMPENQNYQDNFWIDSYTIVKGPAQVLYVNSRVSGVVLKSSKKPLPYEQNIVTASYDDHGGFRVILDSTGPIGMVGGAKLFYRIGAVDQGGTNYFENVKNYRKGVFAESQVNLKETMVRVWYMIQHNKHYAQADGLLTPQGALYTGTGRDFANFPPNDMVNLESKRVSCEVDQHIGSNWEMRLQASNWFYDYQNTPYVYTNSALDWTHDTVGFTDKENNESVNYWTVLDDFNGHYNLGKFGDLPAIQHSDAFGFAYSNYLTIARLWTAPSFGTQIVPFTSQAAINAIQVPTFANFPIPANQGTRVGTILSEIYWQHTVEIVPDHLIVVGGWTWSNIETLTNSNISAAPWTVTDVSVGQLLHRFGAVFKVIPEISLYCLTSTTFTPPGGTATILVNGSLAPPQAGQGNELGLKTSFFGGRLSTDFAWFAMTLTNNLIAAGTVNGIPLQIDAGTGKQEGIDGDVQLALFPGLQVIGTFYAGHDRDYLGVPISNSYDNSWSLFTRYSFGPDTPLRGWAVGTGVSRIGGRWISTVQFVNSTSQETSYSQYTGTIVQPNGSFETGEIKVQTGTLWDGFISYQINKHWIVRLTIDNILNQVYPSGEQSVVTADYSDPLTLSLMTTFKF